MNPHLCNKSKGGPPGHCFVTTLFDYFVMFTNPEPGIGTSLADAPTSSRLLRG